MIRVSDFLDKADNMSDALEKLFAGISRLEPQESPHNRSKMHRMKFLRAAVVGMGWGGDGPLSRKQTGSITYQELISQLEDSVEQERDEELQDQYLVESSMPSRMILICLSMTARP